MARADWRIPAASGSAGSARLAERGIAQPPGELASKTHFHLHLVQISFLNNPFASYIYRLPPIPPSYSFLFSLRLPGRYQFSLFLLGLKYRFLL